MGALPGRDRHGGRDALRRGGGDAVPSRQGQSIPVRGLPPALSRLGIVQSVGRVGSCHDNSAAESFWATLKRELVTRFRFETRNQARHAITAWIRHYNATRLHSSLGNVPPIEWELNYRLQALQAA